MLNSNLSKCTRKKAENIKIYLNNTEIATLICREKSNSYFLYKFRSCQKQINNKNPIS